MIRYILLLSCCLYLVSCKNSGSPEAEKTVVDTAKLEAVYPYPQYIQGQIAYVDTTPLGIEMIVRENGILKDSGFITREKFKTLAADFMDPDPNKKELRAQYEETSFQDLSLNAVTFSITAKDPSLPLQEANILLNPNTQIVKYVLLKKEIKAGDSTESRNMMWMHNMNFQVNSSIVDKSGKETKRQVKVIWDKPLD